DATHPAGIQKMYEFVRTSYDRSRVPLASIELFRRALDILPEDVVQVRLAYHKGTPVAGGITLVFKNTVYAWYGGTTRPPGVAAFDCLTWDEIAWACRNQQSNYDFGGAGWPEEEYGPRHFKAKFGGQLVNYGRYRKVYSGWKLAVAKSSFHVLRSMISATVSK
ncbi:MAG: GNAT family N-acetyltransferase, partial [Planctomycetaceae bacterium]|nr:GNAT family N-acetyltransferase [Planctomycetaceae bacterium]